MAGIYSYYPLLHRKLYFNGRKDTALFASRQVSFHANTKARFVRLFWTSVTTGRLTSTARTMMMIMREELDKFMEQFSSTRDFLSRSLIVGTQVKVRGSLGLHHPRDAGSWNSRLKIIFSKGISQKVDMNYSLPESDSSFGLGRQKIISQCPGKEDKEGLRAVGFPLFLGGLQRDCRFS